MRIVSFLPSATEVLFKLGMGPSVVGRSHECDFPPEVMRIPVASRSELNASERSSRIHDEVWQCHADGRSHFAINVKLLEEVRPDLVIAQDTCSVCALTSAQVRRTVERLKDPPQVLALRATDLEGVFAQIRAIGTATHQDARAEELVRSLHQTLESVGGRRPPRSAWPRVLYLEWFDPLLAGGDWAPELLEWAGAIDLFGARGGPSTSLDWDRIEREDPDAIVLGPCGWDLSRARKESEELRDTPRFLRLRAVREDRCWIVDGKAFLSRSGPRLWDGVEVLARLFHPDVYGLPPGPPSTLPWREAHPTRTPSSPP